MARSSSGEPAALYRLIDQLDQLEELLEDMDALGVASRAEAEARIVELNKHVDVLEEGADE